MFVAGDRKILVRPSGGGRNICDSQGRAGAARTGLTANTSTARTRGVPLRDS